MSIGRSLIPWLMLYSREDNSLCIERQDNSTIPQSTDSENPTSNNKKENGNEQLSGNLRKPQVFVLVASSDGGITDPELVAPVRGGSTE